MNIKTDYLISARKHEGNRKAYVEGLHRTRAIKLLPWANYLLKMASGYWCFESYENYINFKNNVKDNVK
jgi:hypothetical protein